MPKSSGRRTPKRGIPRTRNVQTTLGELIAAAFDTVGNEVKDVARLLASPQIGRAAHRHIVLVQ
jgi:hypothetical protein